LAFLFFWPRQRRSVRRGGSRLADAKACRASENDPRQSSGLALESGRVLDVFWTAAGFPFAPPVSDFGPLLLGRQLGLNATQEGVLALVFKIADDSGLLLLDLKDLRAMLQFVGDNARQFTTQYGKRLGGVDRRDSAGACWRFEQQGGNQFFGEPMLDVDDLLQTDGKGRGWSMSCPRKS